ncbi:hypothetical protein NIE79_001431 [Micromonospora sp. NIE79]|uniref:Uncharacterized protein n=1 Tax=Micromonospora trifolii TaxID=2911208 RepID=A0ABS9MUE6_9ACTN|nr:hypothetical protein [Micromonospora trifolii]MCG5441309.1 hypothetical protein [Micromonospora trifolii]
MTLGLNASLSIVGALGTLGIGSILGQWLAGGKDRREAQARVLEALGKMEHSRWAPHGEKPAFLESARALETAALLGRIPRGYVRFYLSLADAAHSLSYSSWNDYPDEDEGGGGINSKFADLVREAARLLADVSWSGRIFRQLRFARRFNRLNAAVSAISEPEIRRVVDRSRQYAL